MRLSRYFRLGKKQAELDFVDIPLHTDIPLFIDPYSLSVRTDLFSMECSSIVVNFFQKIIDDIRTGNTSTAKYNLSLLGEPNETHLGLSTEKPMGKGVSGKQSVDVFERLSNSRAVQTGFLKDLSDCELVIPRISKDKISDMVTNIIKKKLIDYTEQQCITYGIPTSSVSSGKYWDAVEGRWKEEYVNLPTYKSRIILVPKAIVRYSITYNHRKFYNGFILEYLQEEHRDANTALVTLLKNGNRVVYKKDLKEDSRYKLTKEFLYEFSQEHPEVLEKYVASLPSTVSAITNEEIEMKQDQRDDALNIDALITKLQNIPPGTENASEYHDAMVGILEVIFYPNLYSPNKEEKIHEGRKRIDITYLNGAKNGFFEYLANHIPCNFILCECKNYVSDPANPELDQLSGRFSPRRGKLGLLLCRKIDNNSLMMERCRDTANDDRGFIITLDDEDVIQLLKYRKEGNNEAINQFLTDKYKQLVM